MIATLAPPVLADSVLTLPGAGNVRLGRKALRVGEYDLIILGGGCAGLSLAMRLAALGPRCPRTLVIEQRNKYTNDRTWCFWGDISPRVSHLVRHSWRSIAVRAAGRDVKVDCGSTPYQMIPGEAFYDEALQAIALSERIELAMGEGIVTEPRKFGDKWRIETSEGLRRGAVIVDTRPRQGPIPAGAVLWQSFSGREIECDSDMFDPTCTELMDFSARAPTPINFTYVLPMSRRRALIETTVFGPNPMTESDLANDLKTAVARQVKYSSFRILRSENGILPMGLGPGRRGDDATYVNVGLTAGGARPSTGYAFQRIQRWADSCARLIGEGKLPAGHENDSVLLKSLDYLFVSVLRSRPESAAALFFSFFEKTDAARMIRFMSDRGTIPDFAAIASVLPIFPFIREIPRAILRKALAGR